MVKLLIKRSDDIRKYLLITLIALLLFGHTLSFTERDLFIAGEDDLIDVHNYKGLVELSESIYINIKG